MVDAGPARLAVLVSGRGSNAEAIANACDEGRIPARVVTVWSNVPGAKALERAAGRGIPTGVLAHRGRRDRDAFDAELAAALVRWRPDWVLLAGFMRVLGPQFLGRFPGRVLNIHPSLLPSFPGLHTHRRALEAGVRIHGCTVHLVDESLDGGPIVAQAAVPVLPEDDEDTLAARVLRLEHRLYPQVVAWAASGRLTVVGRRVQLSGVVSRAGEPLVSP